MEEIERIARKLSDRWWEFTDYSHGWHWVVIADTLLHVGKQSGKTIMIARQLEFGSHAELETFFQAVERFSKAGR